MRPSNKILACAILALGINSIIAQIILMRELLIVFYGNEISIGIILGIWLLMGGLGAWGLGQFSDKIAKRLTTFIAGQLLLSIFILSSLFMIRGIKPFFNIYPGEIISLPTMITSSFIILTPICLLLGFLFTLGCRILKTHQEEGAEQVGHVYVLEAIGAASGGILCNFFLIKILASFYIIIILFIFNLLLGLWLLKYTEISSKASYILKILIIGALSTFLFLKLTHNLSTLDNWSKKIGWKGFNLLENRNSIYGNLSVTKQDNLYSFFNNGILMFTIPDLLTQEENIHFAMLQRPDARTVLLIGGGSSGALWEALKYPVEAVDYVELDPIVIELARKHLQNVDFFSLNEPRVKTINADARFFIQNTENLYDVIILSLPDPFTAQLNRFYTVEFFEILKKRLTDDGVFYFGLTSSENYISKELEVFLGSIYSTLKKVFVNIKVIPGDTVYFLASSKPGSLTLDYRELSNRLKKKGIQTTFVRDYYLYSKLSRGRLSYISNRLENASSTSINRDFSPISYYYDMRLWSSYFKDKARLIFKYINRKVIYTIAAMIYIAIILSALFGSKLTRAKRSILVAMATTGFSEISFEVIVIIAFQILYGYLYYKLGLIVTSFMVGLSIGGFLITKRINSIKRPYSEFIKIQIAISLYPLLLPVIFFILHTVKFNAARLLGSAVIFTFLPIIAGLMGGLQFPLANKIYLEKKDSIGRVAGLSYGADMIGSCIGALLISTFIIPIIGIKTTCVLVAALNISSLILLVLNRPR